MNPSCTICHTPVRRSMIMCSACRSARPCRVCGKPLGKDSDMNTRYCSKPCAARARSGVSTRQRKEREEHEARSETERYLIRQQNQGRWVSIRYPSGLWIGAEIVQVHEDAVLVRPATGEKVRCSFSKFDFK
jgi:hypothetical protein